MEMTRHRGLLIRRAERFTVVYLWSSGTWRAAMFPSPSRGSASLCRTPPPPTPMTANRKNPVGCRYQKVHHHHRCGSCLGPSRWPPCHRTNCSGTRISLHVFSSAAPVLMKDQSDLSPLNGQDKKPSEAATAVVETSLPLPVPSKPESVVSITSQCSYSSTIVHVGDKKPQPDSGMVLWEREEL